MINTLPLFCRECYAPWSDIQEETGICTKCNAPNILFEFRLSISLPTTGYDREATKEYWQDIINQLIDEGVLPEGTSID